MQAYSLPDITGDGATHTLDVNSNIRAKWVQVKADAANSGDVRVGWPNGTDVSADFGLPLAKGEKMFYPQDHTDQTVFYPLSQMQYFAGNGDVIYVQYGAG